MASPIPSSTSTSASFSMASSYNSSSEDESAFSTSSSSSSSNDEAFDLERELSSLFATDPSALADFQSHLNRFQRLQQQLPALHIEPPRVDPSLLREIQENAQRNLQRILDDPLPIPYIPPRIELPRIDLPNLWDPFSGGSRKPDIKSIKISYFHLLLPAEETSEDECGICQEPFSAAPTSYFCKHHVFHDACIAQTIYGYSDLFNRNASYLRTDNYTQQQGSFYKKYTGSSYKVTMPEDNPPPCPSCRNRPLHSFFTVTVNDASYGKFSADVRIKNRIQATLTHLASFPFLDKLTAVLTVFQAALAHVQRRPEMTVITLKIQQFLMLPDLFFVTRNYWKLYMEFDRKNKEKSWYTEHPILVRTAIGTALAAATAGLTALGIFFVNRRFSRINFTDILSNFVLPTEMKNVTVKWGAPCVFQTVIQFLQINRIVSELALAFLSPKPIPHLTHAALQSFNFYQISQLKWIELERRIERPLLNVSAKDPYGRVLSSTFCKSVEEVTMKLRCLVPPCFTKTSAFSEESHPLQPFIKSIYEYSSKLFEGSVWSGYTQYDVKLKESIPWLTDIVATTISYIHATRFPGKISFNFI